MKEIAFRITQKQLETVASLLAGNGSEGIVITDCGAGSAIWPSGCERTSWTVFSVAGCTTLSEFDTSFEAYSANNNRKCVFANTMDVLSSVALPNDDVLWGCLEDETLTVFSYQGARLIPVDVCTVVGHDLSFKFCGKNPMVEMPEDSSEFHERTLQAFGYGTTQYLKNLTIGVVGISGTGSIVAEQLMRLGVKRLVLVDDDVVEVRNLGRILNSTRQDAADGVNKAVMMKAAYDRIGLTTEVVAVAESTVSQSSVHLLSQCDILFGCLDSTDGRMHLNRISTFYTIPYFDVGVSLESPEGVITSITGSVRYIIPGESSLASRNVYTSEQLTRDSLRRCDPEAYKARLEEKYIIGAHESSPAVISVNMFYASLCVMDFLNRIHPYRSIPNEQAETIYADLLNLVIPSPDAPSAPDEGLAQHTGRGDTSPLLYLPIMGG